MKKFAYITLFAALIFGIQTPVFSADQNPKALVGSENSTFRMGYDHINESLTIVMGSAIDKERVNVLIYSGRRVVAKEVFMVTSRTQTFNIDLAFLPSGAYTVVVEGRSIKGNQLIKKK